MFNGIISSKQKQRQRAQLVLKQESSRSRVPKPGRPVSGVQMSQVSFGTNITKGSKAGEKSGRSGKGDTMKGRGSGNGSSGVSSSGSHRRSTALIAVPALTHKVIGKMMTSEPISCADLVASISDATLDAVQAILDTLVILGVAYSLKLPSISGASNPTVYTLVGFLRSPEPLNIAEFESLLEQKEKNTQNIRSRIETLRELSDKEMTPEERCSALKEYMEAQMAENSGLSNDPLYQTIKELLVVQIRHHP